MLHLGLQLCSKRFRNNNNLVFHVLFSNRRLTGFCVFVLFNCLFFHIILYAWYRNCFMYFWSSFLYFAITVKDFLKFKELLLWTAMSRPFTAWTQPLYVTKSVLKLYFILNSWRHKKSSIFMCNRVYCIHVPGHDPLIFSFLSFSFLIEWELYGPNYLRC